MQSFVYLFFIVKIESYVCSIIYLVLKGSVDFYESTISLIHSMPRQWIELGGGLGTALPMLIQKKLKVRVKHLNYHELKPHLLLLSIDDHNFVGTILEIIAEILSTISMSLKIDQLHFFSFSCKIFMGFMRLKR